MHYKSEKKHRKKNRKLPKRMKGQESFFDDGLNDLQAETKYHTSVPDKNSDDFAFENRSSRRMRADDSDSEVMTGLPKAVISGQAPRHGVPETNKPVESRSPRRMKQENQTIDYGQYKENENKNEPRYEHKTEIRDSAQYEEYDQDDAEAHNKYTYRKREKPTSRITPKKRISGAWIILICLGLLTLGSLLAWDIFKISKVEISGLKHISYTDVIALSGIKYNQNIFLIDYDGVKNNIETNPILEVTDVSRILPSTIIIDITERKAVAVLSYVGRTVVIDKDCNVVGISDDTISDAMMIVKGAQIKDYSLGETALLHEDEKLEVIKELLSTFEECGTSQYISEIDLSNIDYITLRSSMGLKIIIGSTQNIENKCMWINTSVPKMHSDGQITGVFHITDNNNAYYTPGE